MRQALLVTAGQSTTGDGDLNSGLSHEGREEVDRLAQFMLTEGFEVDAIISATAHRARQTAVALADALGFEDDVEYRPDLDGAPSDAYIGAIGHVPDDANTVLVVGDRAGLEPLADDQSGEPLEMVPSSLADVRLDVESWSALVPASARAVRRVWHPADIARLLREDELASK